MDKRKLDDAIMSLLSVIGSMGERDRISAINKAKQALHDNSPFEEEPVDCVLWVPIEDVEANDYNPNAVAPPEMELLEVSITADGYTQPVVADYDEDIQKFVVVDGFHRNRVARESEVVGKRVKGHLPVVQIRSDQSGRSDRIAATIRHNRARGKHQVAKMSDIVIELKRRNWSDKKIGKELGMDPDEVLRLSQISGLAEAFKDQEFSEAWEVDMSYDDEAVGEIVEAISEG